jgi:hypothetical protein
VVCFGIKCHLITVCSFRSVVYKCDILSIVIIIIIIITTTTTIIIIIIIIIIITSGIFMGALECQLGISVCFQVLLIRRFNSTLYSKCQARVTSPLSTLLVVLLLLMSNAVST